MKNLTVARGGGGGRGVLVELFQRRWLLLHGRADKSCENGMGARVVGTPARPNYHAMNNSELLARRQTCKCSN